jgi:hypothetical protein
MEKKGSTYSGVAILGLLWGSRHDRRKVGGMVVDVGLGLKELSIRGRGTRESYDLGSGFLSLRSVFPSDCSLIANCLREVAQDLQRDRKLQVVVLAAPEVKDILCNQHQV